MKTLSIRLFACLFGTAVVASAAETVVTESVGTNGVMRVFVLADPIYRSYLSRSTASYNRIAMDPSVLPASVDQVTPKLCADVAARSLKDAVAYVPGVYNYSDQGHVLNFCKFHIRGFEQVYSYRDGMRNYGGNVMDLDSLESIDVVKGPNSVQAGMAEVGGYVNYVTKGASLADDSYRNQATMAVSDTGRFTLRGETGGKAMENLATYAAVGYSDGKTFRDANKQVLTANLGLQGRLSDDDLLDIRFTYTRENRDMDLGCLLIDGERIGSIRENWTAGTGLDGLTMDDLYLTGLWTHDFTSHLKSHTRVTYHGFFDTMDCLRGMNWNAAQQRINSRYDGSHLALNELQFNEDIEWLWDDCNWFENTAVAGVEGHWRAYRWHRNWVNGWYRTLDGWWTAPVNAAATLGSAQESDLFSVAPYLQEHAVFFEDFHLTGGLRFDCVRQWNRAAGSTDRTGYHDAALTGNVGFLYELLPWFHPYASYATSFFPNGTQTEPDGSRLDPERGQQFEFGAKLPFLDNRLRLGAACFFIDKENVARTYDATSPYYGYSTADGEVQSRGIELSAQGELGDYVETTASYAYTDAYYVNSSTFDKGARMLSVPHNSGALWTVWHMEGVRSPYGLRAGGGVTAVGARPASIDGGFALKAYCTLNAVIGYGWEYEKGKLADLQINLHNLTNADYWESSGTSTTYGAYPASAMPGAPFGGTITLRFTF